MTLFSPEGNRFRSRAELERFVAKTGALHLNPAIMFRRPPRDKGGDVGRGQGVCVVNRAWYVNWDVRPVACVCVT